MLNIKVQRLKCYRNKKIKTEKLNYPPPPETTTLDNISKLCVKFNMTALSSA